MPITKIPNTVIARRQVLRALAAFSATAGLGLSGIVSASEKESVVAAPWPLWAAQKAGRVVYLMGQTPPRATAWTDTRIEGLVKACGEIWTETNQLRRENPKTLVFKYGLDLKKPLSERLSAADLTRVQQAADLAKLPLEAIAPMRPWLAATTIESAYFRTMKLDESGTAEQVLLRSAKLLNVPHASEFPAQDDVIQFMGEMTAEEDAQFLQYTLDHILKGTTENERVYAAWALGDTKPAAEFVANMNRTQPDLYAKHVVGRNRNWLPRFAEMQKGTKSSLVIVGLYHMAGPDSLIEQLKADGWRVQAA
jgi:uncharacterized protein YbaP (TraB family)